MKYLSLLILLVLIPFAKPGFAEGLCPQAPLPRLTVGAEAVVARSGDGLSLRALPAISTGLRTKLFSGNRLQVIGGPSCNGLYTWWRVQTVNGLSGWVAEGTWTQYYVVPLVDAQHPPTPFAALGQVFLNWLIR